MTRPSGLEPSRDLCSPWSRPGEAGSPWGPMARILVVCNERGAARDLARLLWRDGHRTDLARSDAAALRRLQSRRPDMIVLSVPDPEGTFRGIGREVGSG